MTYFNVLYQNKHILVAQTMANDCYDKANTDHFGGFNLGLHVGDEPNWVLTRRGALLNQLNLLACQCANVNEQTQLVKQLYWLNQIHSDKVLIADDILDIMPKDADALITKQMGVGLAIMTADCVPIAIFDDGDDGGHDKCIACIHAGWQGLTKGIIIKTLSAMPQAKGCYCACIGACISGAAYEVSQTLADDIVNKCYDDKLININKDELYQAIVLPTLAKKVYLDIVRLARLQLTALGVRILSENVPCSYQGAKMGQYYSHRYATHQKWQATGRMATVVVRF